MSVLPSVLLPFYIRAIWTWVLYVERSDLGLGPAYGGGGPDFLRVSLIQYCTCGNRSR
jgi:hypothetical protein